jgi:hypothetical protein
MGRRPDVANIFVAQLLLAGIVCRIRDGQGREDRLAPRALAVPVFPARSVARLHPDNQAVRITQARILIVGRNGSSLCPLRPYFFVDNYVDKPWTLGAWMGMIRR